jgi:hypothetical protein
MTSTAKKTAKRLPARRPAARKARVRTPAKSTRAALADRVIYDSPLKPRHLSQAQIDSIVDGIPG